MTTYNRRAIHAAWLLALAATACGDASSDRASPLPAVALWTQPAGAIPALRAADLRASSREIVWLADAVHRVVLRYDASAVEYRMFGYLDAEPLQLADPLRLAVAQDVGLFVYDRETLTVDLYTPGGQHIRGFQPGFEPLAMYLTRRPFGLVHAALGTAPDSSLSLIWTDLEGVERDTLVGPGSGPRALRGLRFRPGRTFVARSGPGAWVWTEGASDAVFEVRPRREGRRLTLGGAGAALQGMFGDPEAEILWLIRVDGRAVRYEAYDVAGEGALSAGTRFLGVRTTPGEFSPQDVIGGAVIGWRRTQDSANPFVLSAYDLRVGELLGRSSSGRP